MKLIEGLDKIEKPFKNAVVTIGNFDGVHVGHQALFHQVIEKADSIKGTSVALTFEPHPIRVLKKNGNPPLITLYEQKVALIGRSAIDYLVVIPFTLEFAAIPADTFISDVLVQKIGMKAIIIGEDYNFGKNREGDFEMLKSFGERLGYSVIVSNWILTGNGNPERISSTRIREMVMDGQVDEVQHLLGRHYQIRGAVETGRNRGGRLLGFPTANVRLNDELCPKTGVYAVMVECRGALFKGVANIGYSPTFDDHIYTVEVHLLDFNQDIYGEKIKVDFIKRLRDEQKFSDIQHLIDQIQRDVQTARDILAL